MSTPTMSAATPTPTTPTAPAALTPGVSKGRKGAAAGGGKAWTEEEEVYLLQMRLERVAYKKIASHLDKTELACRLHYHQLSHGGNRRKRNSSISSSSSNTSAVSPTTSPSSETPAMRFPRTSSPHNNFSPVNAVSGAIQKVGAHSAAPRPKGKPLLPKPTTTPHKQTPVKGKGLRVNCSPDRIDKNKLRSIVETQQDQFWKSVAEKYGGSFDGEYLRQFWLNGLTSTPPTPAISPSSQANSPTASDAPHEDFHGANTMSTVSEVSTPASVCSVASGPFHSTDVVAIKEETMEDCRAEDPAEERAAAAQKPKIAPLETARQVQEVM